MKAENGLNTTHSFTENSQYHKVEKRSGKRIGYNYIIVKSLKESQKNDVVKCLYIKSLSNFGFCVIKEGTYGDTKDKQERDIIDRLKWQKQLHESLQDKVRIPRLIDSFEENGNYYLVMEYIKGKSLFKICQEQKERRESLIIGNKHGIRLLDYLLQIIDILETLHQEGVVHRDVTGNNFVINPSGKVAIIDMELSYSLQQQSPLPPFQLGTYGYMSPEQEATQTPTTKEDIFSIGAIILYVWTGIAPGKLVRTPIEELRNKIYFFIPDSQIAELIIQCLHSEPYLRPSLQTIHQVINKYKVDLSKKTKRPTSKASFFTREQVLSTIQQAIDTLASPLLADPDKGWFSESMQKQPVSDKNRINKAWYASFNRGAIGIIYMLAQAKKAGLDTSSALPAIQKGLNLIQEKYINKWEDSSPGLHFGSDGIAASLAIAIRNGLLNPEQEYLQWIDRLLEKQHSSLNIMHGAAGQGMANLLCAPLLNSQKINDRLNKYVSFLLEKQEKSGCWVQSDTGTKKRITRGFANGTAGIIYFLLEYAQKYNNRECLPAAQRGLKWLMRNAVHKKGRIQWLSSMGKEITPWWCEGAAGNALTFLKAYEIFNFSSYQKYAVGALQNHHKYTIDNNLSQCHGISGLGEIYLNAYHTLNDTTWFDRASWIVQVLMQLKIQHPKYGPYWLAEQERQPVANFMLGNSGILHFLLRYYYSDKISFPLTPNEKLYTQTVKYEETNSPISLSVLDNKNILTC